MKHSICSIDFWWRQSPPPLESRGLPSSAQSTPLLSRYTARALVKKKEVKVTEVKNAPTRPDPVTQGYDPNLDTIQDFDPKLTHEIARENAAKELAGQLVSTFKFAVWGSI